ncbi:MAG: M48 family metallopeptidase [Bacteroidetes bacterium]|nr:M48 family metallopeptidase [Bacteroidota bacterium]
MKKILFQGFVLVSLFWGLWFGLRQFDWVKILHIQQLTDETEKKLGDLFWDVFKRTDKEVTDPTVLNAVDTVVTAICSANEIDRAYIKVHVLEKDEINAFALPSGHLIVYTGLLSEADSPEEMTGVIGHELAHIELNHVMEKLVTEVGLSVLISMTAGAGGAEAIKSAIKLLSSTAFDRGLEKEADIKAVDYLLNARFNPEPFANFLYKLSKKESESMKYLTWISTHPASKERAEYIIEYSKGKKVDFKPVLSISTWGRLQAAINKKDNP